MSRKGDYIVALDIGTTKTCALISERGEDGLLDILGVGTHPSQGLRKGMVVNIERTVESIVSAVGEAQRMANVPVYEVYVGIAGSHIRSYNSHGTVAVRGPEVAQDDVERVLDAAQAVSMPVDQQLIHVLPQNYIVDNQDGIQDPLGISGVRLEGRAHLVTAAVTAAKNLTRSVEQAGLRAKGLVLEQLASSLSCLTDDERELGVGVVDIGGGTTDLAIFHDHSIQHTAVLPVGGNHITRDLAVGLRTPTGEAERIKRRYGCAKAALVDRNETIEVPGIGGREPRILSRRVLCEIIEPRVEEIFRMVRGEIQKSGYDNLIASGIVITGGSTLLEGMPEIAEETMDIPVRRGIPAGVGGGLVQMVRSPIHATGIGLLLYGLNREAPSNGFGGNGQGGGFGDVYHQMKSVLSKVFQ
ncbi:MAG: cell division protein FtsA [Nitrospinota bacterium]|jgi:cell division protein FtsA|nr:cell division protein FtsA [Nitrospinota bacterium]